MSFGDNRLKINIDQSRNQTKSAAREKALTASGNVRKLKTAGKVLIFLEMENIQKDLTVIENGLQLKKEL